MKILHPSRLLIAVFAVALTAGAARLQASVISFSQTTYDVSEGAGSVVLTVRVDRSNDPDPGANIQVDYRTLAGSGAGSATPGSDYNNVGPETLTFGPGETSKSFAVPILEDSVFENPETFSAILSNPRVTNAGCTDPTNQDTCYYKRPTFGNSSATVRILDNERGNTIQFSPASYSVSEAGPGGVPGQAVLTVTANRVDDPNTVLSVNYTTEDGTAVAGSDYGAQTQPEMQVVTFGPGETQKTITITLINDGLIENGEDFTVTLTGFSNARPGTGATTARVTILDDDGGTSVIQFSASTYSVNESAGAAKLRVVRSGGIGFAVTVNYSTSDGSAVAPTDYSAARGTVSFAPGEYSKELPPENMPPITVIDDADAESSENFSVSLSSPGANAALGTPAMATVTITDNDAGNTIQFSPAAYTASEVSGNAEPGVVVLTISANRTGDPNTVLQVNYVTRNDTAVDGQDYNFTAGTVTFNAGETQKQVTIQLINDNLIEATENFFVDLANPSNAALSSAATATVSISDDDGGTSTIQFTAPEYSAAEGDGSALVTAVRSGGIGFTVSADYSTADGSAAAGQDYTLSVGSITFAPGEYSKQINIPILQDDASESSENFSISLSNPSANATLGTPPTATINILDDEGPPVITSPRNASGQRDESFSYRITATNTPTRFGANGLPPGLSVDTASGLISGRPTDFGTFEVEITAMNNRGTSTAILTLTIVSGGTTLVQFRTELYTATSPQSSVTLIVDLSRASGDNDAFSVDYSTNDGSAKAGQDYAPQSGTLFFGNGEKRQTITIAIAPSDTPRSDRTFFVNLFNPSRGAVGRNPATVVLSFPDFSTKLMNISTRAPVQSGEGVMIAGFIVQGDAPKRVVLRAVGPTLTARGLASAIQDTTLTLNNSNGSQIAFNDDFGQNSAEDRQTLDEKGLSPEHDREAAVVATLAPGIYTAILRGKTNGSGLVELYDISGTTPSRLVNIATRARVNEGDEGAMIAGFIVATPQDQPGTAQRVVIRAIGPSLSAAGITDVLENPTLEIYRGSEKILQNDDWKTNQRQLLEGSGLAPRHDKEAAIMVDLDPGSYSAVIRGKSNATGVALAEVYQLNQ
jgi:hypothetical protein